MILEGIVTTLSDDGTPNLAPMGPKVEDESFRRFVLRPFRSSTTYMNLRRRGEGVLHVTDDVLTIAKAVVGADTQAQYRAAQQVSGAVWLGAARYHEFRVVDLDDGEERTTIVAESVFSGHLKDLFGLNRGKYAVVEAAILVTRLHLLSFDEVIDSFRELSIIVEKTGGSAELEAFRLLSTYLETYGKKMSESSTTEQLR